MGVNLGALVVVGEDSVQNYFVGSFLTSSVIYFPSMRATLANVWHSIGGITIINLTDRRYLFRLYYRIDANRIKSTSPWTFNSHLLILHRLQEGKDPRSVQLYQVDFWVLVKELPIGFVIESVVVQMGNFVGKFLDFYRKAVLMGHMVSCECEWQWLYTSLSDERRGFCYQLVCPIMLNLLMKN